MSNSKPEHKLCSVQSPRQSNDSSLRAGKPVLIDEAKPDNPKPEPKELKLAKEVNEFLYYNHESTRVCMEWVTANVDLEVEKARREVLKEVEEIADVNEDFDEHEVFLVIKKAEFDRLKFQKLKELSEQ